VTEIPMGHSCGYTSDLVSNDWEVHHMVNLSVLSVR
jgi:hypothetical protein